MGKSFKKQDAEILLKSLVAEIAAARLSKIRWIDEKKTEQMTSALKAYEIFAPHRAKPILEDPGLNLEQMFFHVVRDYLDYTDEVDAEKVLKEISRKIPLSTAEERNFVYDEGETSYGEEKIGEYHVYIASAQGPREQMEDAHLITKISLDPALFSEPQAFLFGVFDGHGGASCAHYVKKQLPELLEKELLGCKEGCDLEIYNSLRRACIELDRSWSTQPFQDGVYRDASGTTAAICLLIGKTLWTANVGDSRVVYVEKKRVIQLSEEAKVTIKKYQNEIYQRGGITRDDRVIGETGTLNMARSIGDVDQPSISAMPSIRKYENLFEKREGAYLILACDGLWDVVDPKLAARLCLDARTGGAAALKLLTTAFSRGTTDNVTILVITPYFAL